MFRRLSDWQDAEVHQQRGKPVSGIGRPETWSLPNLHSFRERLGNQKAILDEGSSTLLLRRGQGLGHQAEEGGGWMEGERRAILNNHRRRKQV